MQDGSVTVERREVRTCCVSDGANVERMGEEYTAVSFLGLLKT